MGKSLQLTTKLRKCSTSRNILLADRISGLPDDILIAILSHLTMKEAASTTVLSHRWDDLWMHTTGCLDFDDSRTLTFWTLKLYIESRFRKPDPVEEGPLVEADRVLFVGWVNRILKSHKGATIDGFRVHFDLDSSFRSDIDSWINFALQKRARRLELDLDRLFKPWEGIYPFPEKSVIGHPTINSLTHLKLNYVNVTRELLEYILSNCPFLEFLCVRCSRSPVGAKVDAASPKLHYLEISCLNVECLEISSAINLRTLKFFGPEASLCFKNAPNLIDVSFGGSYCKDIAQKLHGHSFSQIEKLKLNMSCYIFETYDRFPILKNLKQLELVVKGWDPHGVLHYATLLEKCPMLYRLWVQFNWLEDPKEIEIQERECRLECLKFIEMSAFRGSRTDLELATFLIKNSPCLEKIIIDTRDPPSYSGTLWEPLQKDSLAAQESATQLLSTKLSPGVEYLIL
ncbi:hypothetical protein LguiA_028361 [Lonicera macranthoides]